MPIFVVILIKKTMKINKEDFKEALTFLWISIIFFLVTVDAAFPFIIFMMKVVFYIIGSLMLLLGITTMYKAIFGKKRKDINDDVK